MQIDAGSAYGEAFETASAALRFEGTGVRLDTSTCTSRPAA